MPIQLLPVGFHAPLESCGPAVTLLCTGLVTNGEVEVVEASDSKTRDQNIVTVEATVALSVDPNIVGQRVLDETERPKVAFGSLVVGGVCVGPDPELTEHPLVAHCEAGERVRHLTGQCEVTVAADAPLGIPRHFRPVKLQIVEQAVAVA